LQSSRQITALNWLPAVNTNELFWHRNFKPIINATEFGVLLLQLLFKTVDGMTTKVTQVTQDNTAVSLMAHNYQTVQGPELQQIE